MMIIVSFIAISYIPFCTSTRYDESFYDDVYIFEDAKVFLIGRVRTAFSANGKWRPPLYIGNESFAGVFSEGTPLERLNVFVQNKTTTKILHRLKNVEVRMINTSGIFFIAVLKQISVHKIPPLVFIWSYSDRVIIRPFP